MLGFGRSTACALLSVICHRLRCNLLQLGIVSQLLWHLTQNHQWKVHGGVRGEVRKTEWKTIQMEEMRAPLSVDKTSWAFPAWWAPVQVINSALMLSGRKWAKLAILKSTSTSFSNSFCHSRWFFSQLCMFKCFCLCFDGFYAIVGQNVIESNKLTTCHCLITTAKALALNVLSSMR